LLVAVWLVLCLFFCLVCLLVGWFVGCDMTENTKDWSNLNINAKTVQQWQLTANWKTEYQRDGTKRRYSILESTVLYRVLISP